MLDITEETVDAFANFMGDNLKTIPGHTKICVRCYYFLDEFQSFKLMCLETEYRLLVMDVPKTCTEKPMPSPKSGPKGSSGGSSQIPIEQIEVPTPPTFETISIKSETEETEESQLYLEGGDDHMHQQLLPTSSASSSYPVCHEVKHDDNHFVVYSNMDSDVGGDDEGDFGGHWMQPMAVDEGSVGPSWHVRDVFLVSFFSNGMFDR